MRSHRTFALDAALAIGVALLVMAGAYVLFALLVPPLRLTEADAPTWYTAAQVFFGLFSIGLTSFLGTFAYREFVQRQLVPELTLRVRPARDDDPGQGMTEATVYTGRNVAQRFDLLVVNSGRVASTWFMVQCSVPLNTLALEPVAGKDDVNWRRWHKGTTPHFTFLSSGSVGAFPGWPLVLAQLNVSRNDFPGGKPVVLTFQIGSDRTPPVGGELRLVPQQDPR